MIRFLRGFAAAALLLTGALTAPAAEDQGDELVQMVVNLLGDKDKDLRAVGLEQVRKEVKGAAATKQFAEQLPKLSAEAQVGLLSALGDRGDRAAQPAMIELLSRSSDEAVRAAAAEALGTLGDAADLPVLVKLLAAKSPAEQRAARNSLTKLRGDGVPAALAERLKSEPGTVRLGLLDVLVRRRAVNSVSAILPLATDNDPAVRAAAMLALGQLAAAEHLAGMLPGVLKAEPGAEREAAEKAVALVGGRIADPNERATPILLDLAKLSEADQHALLPMIGRVGGAKAMAYVEKALGEEKTPRREAALRALANWPDASVADKLLALTKQADNPAQRMLLFQAFVRVGSLRGDMRSDQDRLERMRQAMAIVKSDEERSLVINRCRAAYIVDALRYVLPYLDQPQFAQIACESIVELAHHRELREPNKAEFDAALDRVKEISKDAVVIERATRYKKGETWERPKAPMAP